MEIPRASQSFAVLVEDVWALGTGGVVSCGRNLCWGERVLGKGARKDFGSARCTGLEEERGGLAEACDSNVAGDEESSRSNFCRG